MKTSNFGGCCYLVMAMLGVLSASRAESSETVRFNRDIRPILSQNCYECHGPDAENRKANLRFDQESSAKAERDGKAAIVPGKPEESELIRRINAEDEFTRMPPPESNQSLSPAEIDLLRRWIAQGAEWSRHWAYVPPQKHAVPKVSGSDWPRNWIDHFILSRLKDEGLQPAPEAEKVTLIRRLSFDLTGLPPSPEEVDAFVRSRDPLAYETLVDRLLASKHFGERMAMYWLDLVRYADTVGYHGDQTHAITPYRDWVIYAFNENMPFDQFTREQLAGDLLPDAGVNQKIASGYNRLLQTSHEGGVQPKEYLAIYAADRVRNLSAVWMAGTMGCAQCHDHKYDPYTMRDFYSMEAFFADIDEAKHFKVGNNALPTRRPPEMKVLTPGQRAEIRDLENKIEQHKDKLASLADDDSQRKTLKAQIAQLSERRDKIENSKRKTMITASIEPRTIRILPRGNWMDDSGPIVQPAVPEFLGELDTGEERATRLDLANWLVDAEEGAGGLTARVFANRFWYLLFGVGIAKDLDDFGNQGEPPVYPKLLDNLAMEFVESGWDVKHMMKRIVMSQAYRQSSQVGQAFQPEAEGASQPRKVDLRKRDPKNRLYARQSRHRLPAEMIRDNTLAISGLLVEKVGGKRIKPYQPHGYYRHLNFPKRTYEHHTDERQWRRGLYMHWQRQFLHPMLKAFDAPRREECTAQRPRSNTPLAALVLLNDPTFVEASRAFAERILQQGGTTVDDRLDYAFRRAVSRRPDPFERDTMKDLLTAGQKRFQSDPQAAKKLLSVGLKPVDDDLDPAQLAAWSEVARAILNLNETMTRN